MKWYRIPSIITCGLNTVLAAIVLCLAAYDLLTDKTTKAPTTTQEKWINLITYLVPFGSVWIVISLVGIFVSMTSRQAFLASLVLLLTALTLGASVYIVLRFEEQTEMDDEKAEQLFNATLQEISSKNEEAWIPGWLDNIQKQSKLCCGVVTYRDYVQFWPHTPSRIPRSCCKGEDPYGDPCPEDLTHIPYPDTPAKYLKVEAGCMDEINEGTRRRIHESFMLSLATAAALGCGTLAFILCFILQYLVKSKDNVTELSPENLFGGPDAPDGMPNDSNAVPSATNEGPNFNNAANFDASPNDDDDDDEPIPLIPPPLLSGAGDAQLADNNASNLIGASNDEGPASFDSLDVSQLLRRTEPTLGQERQIIYLPESDVDVSPPQGGYLPQFDSSQDPMPVLTTAAKPAEPRTSNRENAVFAGLQQQQQLKQQQPQQQPPPQQLQQQPPQQQLQQQPPQQQQPQLEPPQQPLQLQQQAPQQQQQQQPLLPLPSEAASGDDNMTIGGGNIGRREVFIAQDSLVGFSATDPQQVFSSGTGSGSTNDGADDIIVMDVPQPPDPPKETKGRKKKGRKLSRN